MGLLLAGHLQRLLPVVLLRRAGTARSTLELALQDKERRERCLLEQVGTDLATAPIRQLIVCTKAYDAAAAVESVRRCLATDTRILLMQNGMGSQQAVAAAFPELSVYAASSTEGAYRPAPDTVVHAGRGITRIGRLQGAAHDWTALFKAAGLAAETAEPIEWHLANKLRVNALINPLTVLYRCRNGELLANPAAYRRMAALGMETDAVLAAAGYRFEEPALAVAEQVARATAANYSSMYQDAHAGRRLEIDYINGYLSRLGRELGVPTPAHDAIGREIASAMSADSSAGSL